MTVKCSNARRLLLYPLLVCLTCLAWARAGIGQASLSSDGYPNFFKPNDCETCDRKGEMEMDCDTVIDFCKEKEEERRLKRVAEGDVNTCLDTYMELACYPSYCCNKNKYNEALTALVNKLNDNGCVDKINPHWTPISVAMWKHVSQCSPDEDTYCVGDSKCDCAYLKDFNKAPPDCCCSPEYMPEFGCDGSDDGDDEPNCCNKADPLLTHWCRTPQLCADGEAESVDDCPTKCSSSSTSIVGEWTNGFCQPLNDEYEAEKYYALMDDHELDKHQKGGTKRIRSVKYVCLKTSRNVHAFSDSSLELRREFKGEDASMGIFLYEQEDCNSAKIESDISSGVKSWEAGSEPYFMRLVLPSVPCVAGTSFITCKYNPRLAAGAGDNEALSDVESGGYALRTSVVTLASMLSTACWYLMKN